MARTPKKSAKAKRQQTQRRLIAGIVLLAVVLLAGSSWGWWHYVRSHPRRVFMAMLANNLQTTGVTRHLVQATEAQTLDQMVQLATEPDQLVHSRTVLSQTGNVEAAVVTESWGTPTTDYVRYLDVITSQRTKDGQELDFSTIKNVWGQSHHPDGTTNGELYSETILGAFPLANLPAPERQKLLKFINDQAVYEVDYNRVERTKSGGRPRYTYHVRVKPETYINMLKQFGEYIGLTQLRDVDASAYQNAQPFNLEVTVDVWSRQAVAVTYAEAIREERFSSFGLRAGGELPTATIDIDELQRRVQNIR